MGGERSLGANTYVLVRRAKEQANELHCGALLLLLHLLLPPSILQTSTSKPKRGERRRKSGWLAAFTYLLAYLGSFLNSPSLPEEKFEKGGREGPRVLYFLPKDLSPRRGRERRGEKHMRTMMSSLATSVGWTETTSSAPFMLGVWFFSFSPHIKYHTH